MTVAMGDVNQAWKRFTANLDRAEQHNFVPLIMAHTVLEKCLESLNRHWDEEKGKIFIAAVARATELYLGSEPYVPDGFNWQDYVKDTEQKGETKL